MSHATPLPTPTAPPALTADIAAAGPVIAPIERIRLFSPAQWEDFVLEWAHSLRTEYARVDRCGGAGDMGRDVIAIPNEADVSVWDNYQCKHYDQPLHLLPRQEEIAWRGFGDQPNVGERRQLAAPPGIVQRCPQHIQTAIDGAVR